MRASNLISEKRGGALLAVFVIATSLAVIIASLFSHSMSERRINKRHELRLISKNASEAIAEYGFAQLRHKFENRTNFSMDALKPGSSDELTMPASSLFGSVLDYEKSELVGGTVPDYPTELTYIDPVDPANEFDPLRGQKVYARNIGIYAKAVVNDPLGGSSITSYISQKLQVRDAPLFAHAIFYNLDLEVSPGPKMDIFGPVHTNGDLYLQGIDGVDFHYPVSTSKDMFYGWGTGKPSAQGSGNERLQTGDVRFKNRAGDLVSMKDGGSFMDSNRSDWREYASNRWNGNLLTQEHGVETYQPVAFPDYKKDDPSTHEYDPVNSGHALIEPPLPTASPDYNAEIEKQKLSTKAGLYFSWDVETGEVKAFDGDGYEYDISNLEGPGSDYLYEIKENAMQDKRRNKQIDMVDFNVGKLKQLIENPDVSSPNGHIGVYDPDIPHSAYNPGSEWNGIVYFETKTSSSNAQNQERLHHSGIRVWGGETDRSGQGIPSYGEDPGLTFATNNALYVKGHFNADGTLHDTWTSENSALVPEVGEVPVALYGDSVTILSNSWDDSITSSKPDASSTEVAAAIVSGLIPSDARSNGKSSGGVHNFPRFLEDWGGKSLYIRGSLVCLYESEVDDSQWQINYYSPPARKWGFSQLFLNGTFPPGTPLLRTYRRVDYTDLTQTEYENALRALPWGGEES
ncbi:hypothetical protein [Pelagicoccus sp. SDUM812003]|uniref:hypothetical protein n=1 Tax=Pelagicoccus sp. SDUM812003 TaxID=3041267 RepID=UPI00280D9F1D|nr:hypothetical protein [Pelagicoccus sp. SDUM812003]MDQ8203680.1 hypothetical protein [Pelagicoccus sp. SDUM812003]